MNFQGLLFESVTFAFLTTISVIVFGLISGMLLQWNPFFIMLESNSYLLKKIGFYTILTAIIIHEVSHTIACLLLGGKVKTISFTESKTILVFRKNFFEKPGRFIVAVAPTLVVLICLWLLKSRPVMMIAFLPFLCLISPFSWQDIKNSLAGMPFWLLLLVVVRFIYRGWSIVYELGVINI